MRVLALYLVRMILLLTFLSSQVYLYRKGMHDGIENYKQSKEFALTMKSAYHFGYMDGKQGLKESWEGEE